MLKENSRLSLVGMPLCFNYSWLSANILSWIGYYKETTVIFIKFAPFLLCSRDVWESGYAESDAADDAEPSADGEHVTSPLHASHASVHVGQSWDG